MARDSMNYSQSVLCDWSMCPMWLVNASGTNDVVIRLSALINYMNWCQVEVKNICFNTADGQWLIGPARPASSMFVAHWPWRTSTADTLTFSSDALTLSADALTFASDALTNPRLHDHVPVISISMSLSYPYPCPCHIHGQIKGRFSLPSRPII